MQDFDWNSLKLILVVRQAGSFSGAARLLGIDETTVSRRVRALERQFGLPLFQREVTEYRATDAALPFFAFAEKMEREGTAAAEDLRRHVGAIEGTVRLSAVPFLAQRVLVPALASLKAVSPEVTVELIADARNALLEQNEADIALRFARPTRGGLGIQARQIGEISFVACAPANAEPSGWVSYDAAHRDLP